MQLWSSCFQYIRKLQHSCSPLLSPLPSSLPSVCIIKKPRMSRNTFHRYSLKDFSSQCKIPKYLSLIKDYSKDFQSVYKKYEDKFRVSKENNRDQMKKNKVFCLAEEKYDFRNVEFHQARKVKAKQKTNPKQNKKLYI